MPCNFCHDPEADVLYNVREQITGEQKEFAVLKCRNCGLAFTEPQPSISEIGKYYPEESYYSFQPADYNTLKEKLRTICLEEAGGYPHKNGNDFFSRVIRKTIFMLFGNHISVVIPYIKNGKVLDVGCGSGKLLYWLNLHGWDTYGVELSSKAAECAAKKGLNIFNGELAEAKYPDNYFDFVIVNQVLEHLHDPMSLLVETNRILKAGGQLLIGVPNLESYESRIFGMYWSHLDIPRHLHHFSFPILEVILQSTGFDIERVIGKTFFIPYSNKLSLRQLIMHENIINSAIAAIRVYLLKFPAYLLYKPKYKFGQFITIYATKRVELDNPR
jgi:methionine biosynthesis protein MetW